MLEIIPQSPRRFRVDSGVGGWRGRDTIAELSGREAWTDDPEGVPHRRSTEWGGALPLEEPCGRSFGRPRPIDPSTHKEIDRPIGNQVNSSKNISRVLKKNLPGFIDTSKTPGRSFGMDLAYPLTAASSLGRRFAYSSSMGSLKNLIGNHESRPKAPTMPAFGSPVPGGFRDRKPGAWSFSLGPPPMAAFPIAVVSGRLGPGGPISFMDEDHHRCASSSPPASRAATSTRPT